MGGPTNYNPRKNLKELLFKKTTKVLHPSSHLKRSASRLICANSGIGHESCTHVYQSFLRCLPSTTPKVTAWRGSWIPSTVGLGSKQSLNYPALIMCKLLGHFVARSDDRTQRTRLDANVWANPFVKRLNLKRTAFSLSRTTSSAPFFFLLNRLLTGFYRKIP